MENRSLEAIRRVVAFRCVDLGGLRGSPARRAGGRTWLMTVSLGIKHLGSGRYDVFPVATNEEFTSRWLPACARLGLRFVPRFHDGSLTTIATEDVQGIVAELQRLRAWANTSEDSAHMIERIDGVLRSLSETVSEGCEYDLGADPTLLPSSA
jgi:hypothetical protein